MLCILNTVVYARDVTLVFRDPIAFLEPDYTVKLKNTAGIAL